MFQQDAQVTRQVNCCGVSLSKVQCYPIDCGQISGKRLDIHAATHESVTCIYNTQLQS